VVAAKTLATYLFSTIHNQILSSSCSCRRGNSGTAEGCLGGASPCRSMVVVVGHVHAVRTRNVEGLPSLCSNETGWVSDSVAARLDVAIPRAFSDCWGEKISVNLKISETTLRRWQPLLWLQEALRVDSKE
jgi:hypothetical protein